MPRKILAIGLNYRSHAEESDLDVPAVPVVFAMWTSALVGPDEDIVVPIEETRPDFEGEVAVVLGERVYRASEDDARRAIGGITAIHDVSGRRAQLETPLRQFTLGKSFDTFAPLGPCIASPGQSRPRPDRPQDDACPARSCRRPGRTTSSSRSRISSSTSRKGLTLEAGDVIATGTPGGVGDSRTPPRYLEEGDVVEVWVEGVGTLRNRVSRERA